MVGQWDEGFPLAPRLVTWVTGPEGGSFKLRKKIQKKQEVRGEWEVQFIDV